MRKFITKHLKKAIFFAMTLTSTGFGIARAHANADTPHDSIRTDLTTSNGNDRDISLKTDRFSILMDFEGFRPGVDWTVNTDAGSRAFGPFQFNMGETGQFQYFMKWLQTHDSEIYERLNSANAAGTAKFKIVAEDMFKTEPHLFDLMKEFETLNFEAKLVAAETLHGINCESRGEIVMGFLLCLFNNRNNDMLKVLSHMAEICGGAERLNTMRDADFYELLGTASQNTLSQTIPENRWKKSVLENFSRIHDAYRIEKQEEQAANESLTIYLPAMESAAPLAQKVEIAQTIADLPTPMNEMAPSPTDLPPQPKAVTTARQPIISTRSRHRPIEPEPPEIGSGLLKRAEYYHAKAKMAVTTARQPIISTRSQHRQIELEAPEIGGGLLKRAEYYHARVKLKKNATSEPQTAIRAEFDLARTAPLHKMFEKNPTQNRQTQIFARKLGRGR